MKRRGFLMIMVLFLSIILLTLGFGYLGGKVGQYQSTLQSALAAQARCLARSGIEDARVKLNLDLSFPPQPGMSQNQFTYSEDVRDSSGTYLGCYRVCLDSTYVQPAYSILIITSTGEVGPRGAPTASHTYRACLDVAQGSALYFRIVRWDDLGTI